MPVYNEAKFLKGSIQSILDQNYKDFEFLILNDNSTDNSEEIILSYKDPRIKYVKVESKGISALLNYGVSIASGKLIARMDADDIAMPQRLEKQMHFVQDSDENFISSAWFATFKNKKIINIVKHPTEDYYIKKKLNTSNPICHPLVIFHKSFFIKLRGYNEGLDCLEDHDLWLEARNRAEFGNIPEVLLLKREKENSLSALEKRMPRSFIYNLLNNHFEGDYYKSLSRLKNDKLKLEYYYGSKNKLRRRLQRNNVFSIKRLYYFFYSFMPEVIFRKKPESWLKWKTNKILSLISPKRRNLSRQLRKYA
ncbi:hypothetical protein BH10BAC5_BH10BAC5_14500 [soil metagenome]